MILNCPFHKRLIGFVWFEVADPLFCRDEAWRCSVEENLLIFVEGDGEVRDPAGEVLGRWCRVRQDVSFQTKDAKMALPLIFFAFRITFFKALCRSVAWRMMKLFWILTIFFFFFFWTLVFLGIFLFLFPLLLILPVLLKFSSFTPFSGSFFSFLKTITSICFKMWACKCWIPHRGHNMPFVLLSSNDRCYLKFCSMLAWSLLSWIALNPDVHYSWRIM